MQTLTEQGLRSKRPCLTGAISWVLSWFAPRYWASWLLENPLEDLQKISYLDASWTKLSSSRQVVRGVTFPFQSS